MGNERGCVDTVVKSVQGNSSNQNSMFCTKYDWGGSHRVAISLVQAFEELLEVKVGAVWVGDD